MSSIADAIVVFTATLLFSGGKTEAIVQRLGAAAETFGISERTHLENPQRVQHNKSQDISGKGQGILIRNGLLPMRGQGAWRSRPPGALSSGEQPTASRSDSSTMPEIAMTSVRRRQIIARDPTVKKKMNNKVTKCGSWLDGLRDIRGELADWELKALEHTRPVDARPWQPGGAPTPLRRREASPANQRPSEAQQC